MRKILLAVVVVALLLVSPAAADAPLAVIVDGNTLSAPGLLINGSTYVPLRAVGESMGAAVEWDGEQVTVTSAKPSDDTLKRPNINGSDSQKEKVEAALTLLQEKDPPDYELVCRHVKVININDDKKVLGSTLTYTAIDSGKTFGESIKLTETLFNKYDNIFIASVIVHEATHLCNAQNKNITTNNKIDENIAYLREIAALRILGASQSLIDGTEATRIRVINR